MKIHKLTILLSVPPDETIVHLKQHALAAISQFQASDPDFEASENEKIPSLNSVEQFELHKRVKSGRKFTGETSLLDEEESVKNVLANWEAVILRIRDENGWSAR